MHKKFTIEAENNLFIEMTFKDGDAEKLTVVRVEENGDIRRQRPQIRSLCLDCFTSHLDAVLDKMCE